MKQLMEMANVRGNYVVTDNINFSFYFSDKTECNHAIRAKIKWNPAKVSGSLDGYVELHGDLPALVTDFFQGMELIGRSPKTLETFIQHLFPCRNLSLAPNIR